MNRPNASSGFCPISGFGHGGSGGGLGFSFDFNGD